jgi:large-conductance mechanosensitive channel
MDEAGKTFGFDRADARKWTGRMLMAVIMGLAIWNLIAAVMDYVVVPWIGDMMGQSSGLPTSFTQRPYDYPDLLVSVLEFCIAGIVAISINWYFQRPGRPVRVKVVKTSSVARQTTVVPGAPVPPQPVVAAVITPPTPSVVASPAPAPAPVAQVAAPAPAPAAAKPVPAPPPKPQPAKPQAPKEVYYNIVGEPLPPDED